jgi:hypothetical protein
LFFAISAAFFQRFSEKKYLNITLFVGVLKEPFGTVFNPSEVIFFDTFRTDLRLDQL